MARSTCSSGPPTGPARCMRRSAASRPTCGPASPRTAARSPSSTWPMPARCPSRATPTSSVSRTTTRRSTSRLRPSSPMRPLLMRGPRAGRTWTGGCSASAEEVSVVELRTKLTDDERDLVNKLTGQLGRLSPKDKLYDSYYEGSQKLAHIGLAVPEELRIFELVANWPRMYLDEVSRRQKVKSIYRPGADTADAALQEAFEANNLEAEVPILAKENMIFGRCFVSVGTNEDDKEHPLITVESPRQMSCLVSQRKRRMEAALRRYREQDGTQVATLFLPDKTIQLVATSHGWDIDEVGGDLDVDVHGLGRVPVVLFLNRRRLGEWTGTTEMADVIPLTDACARALTDLQYGVETVAVPKRFVLGMSKGDFVDKDGKPIP